MNVVIATICFFVIAACAPSANDKPSLGLEMLHWVEKPASQGVSHLADPKDRTQFDLITSFDQERPNTFEARKAMLREGDLVAY